MLFEVGSIDPNNVKIENAVETKTQKIYTKCFIELKFLKFLIHHNMNNSLCKGYSIKFYECFLSVCC